MSGRSIQSSSFLTRLVALVTELAPDQRKIMFEITDSAAIQNVDEAEAVIRMLRRRGHSLCLDDFGAGFSAFTYLRHFEVDFGKPGATPRYSPAEAKVSGVRPLMPEPVVGCSQPILQPDPGFPAECREV